MDTNLTNPGIEHVAVALRREERAARRADIKAEHVDAMLSEGWVMVRSASDRGWALVPPQISSLRASRAA